MPENEMKHTSEPWCISQSAPSKIFAHFGEEAHRYKIAQFYIENSAQNDFPQDATTAHDFANAERAVVCVNACAGLSDSAIRWGVVPALVTSTLENALCWFLNMDRGNVAGKMHFNAEAEEKFAGMLSELVSAVNATKAERSPDETADEIEARVMAHVRKIRTKEDTTNAG